MAKSKAERGRFSSRKRKKVEAVLQVLRNEDLDLVSRELGGTAAPLSEWRDQVSRGRPGQPEESGG
jgi:transposase-like protein